MYSIQDLVLAAIAVHLEAQQFEFSMGANGLRIPALAIVIRVHDGEQIPRDGDMVAISAIVQAGAMNSIGGGIDVLHTGMGESLDEAASNAAHQWIIGVLPVLISYLKHVDVSDVEHSQMVVAVEDTREQFGWDVHLGPIITRVYGDIGTPGDLPKSTIFLKLFNVLHPFAAHSTLFWLECFAVRYPDGRVDATCRKHNDDWPEGKQALLEWASEWPLMGDGFVSQRQFIIFQPTAVEKLPAGRELAGKLPLPGRKPWWRRLWP